MRRAGRTAAMKRARQLRPKELETLIALPRERQHHHIGESYRHHTADRGQVHFRRRLRHQPADERQRHRSRSRSPRSGQVRKQHRPHDRIQPTHRGQSAPVAHSTRMVSPDARRRVRSKASGNSWSSVRCATNRHRATPYRWARHRRRDSAEACGHAWAVKACCR